MIGTFPGPEPIERIETRVLDIPLVRPHRFSVLTITSQAVLLVRLTTRGGVVGVGEGVVPGGPWWGGESVEGMRELVDRYLAPLLVGEDVLQVGRLAAEMDRLVTGAPFAKSAVETALWDACGKAVGLPVWQLLGGLRRTELPVTWALGAEPAPVAVDEATRLIESGRHSRFKLKMGASDPAEDVARVVAITGALRDRAQFAVDLNGSWDETTARRWLPALDDAGVLVVEQPLPAWNLAGAARLRDRHRVEFMADESVLSVADANRVAAAHAADVLALKIAKCGGVSGVQRIAVTAESHGITCYGGTTIETSVGTAAALHAFCALPGFTGGSELFGPLLLADDIVVDPVRYAGGDIAVTGGPGFGVTLDEDKVAKYERN